MSEAEPNLHSATVKGFGDEWTAFDQQDLAGEELQRAFDAYFRIFPWEALDPDAVGFDAGCGSGRWARLVAPRVARLHCVDASADALRVAKRALEGHPNCIFYHASVGALTFEPESMDFGYSLGVLHHVPDTAAAISACVQALRPGAPLLLYLYYALDGRPWWYRELWRISDRARHVVSRLPHGAKLALTLPVALGVYWPLARVALIVERLGGPANRIPLAFYRRHSLYTMRTDAYDRFGTRLERRFTASQVRELMIGAGLDDVRLSEEPPFWCAVGVRR